MPGAALAAMASVLGRTLCTSPKESWQEPPIIWVGDIRSSGQGKTPSVRKLLNPIYKAQQKTDETYQTELDRLAAKPKKDREREVPPRRPQGHFATDLTLEGIRMDVQGGHGGLLCVLDELSALLSSQNQYKKKGSDREALISLWDGQPARISRAGKSMTISGARMSIIGGIQPPIFRMAFGGDHGVYLSDGTVFRFLFTYESDSFVPLTNESWSDGNRNAWESTLTNAMAWSDNIISVEGWRPHVLRLSEDAWIYFMNYRNDLHGQMNLYPAPIKGFIPKSDSYVLRIAGILDCIRQFSCGTKPGRIITREDIEIAVAVTEFYLAHTLSAMRYLESDTTAAETSEITTTLVRTLALLRTDLDSGRLAIGYIFEKFNELCSPTIKVKSGKALGPLLREHGLTTTEGKHDANGRRSVHCLIWDEKAEQFVRTLQTSVCQRPQAENLTGTDLADISDIADIDGEEEFDIEGTL